jgi:hypothetical protein
MVTDPERQNGDPLDHLLQAARDGEAPSAALVARVLADAEAVQSARLRAAEARVEAKATAPHGRGWLAGWRAALGGWPALSGVAVAGVAGLGLGFFAPDTVAAALDGPIWALTGGTGAVPDLGNLAAVPAMGEAGDV